MVLCRGMVALAAAACCPALEKFERVEGAMGTLVRATVYARDPEQASGGFRAAFARLHALDKLLSDYDPASELNRLSTHPVRVSGDLWKVLTASQQMADASNGAFDVTAGPLTHLWRGARRTHTFPSEGEIARAVERTGWRWLRLDRGLVSVMKDDMQLDLGGIAKGYAASVMLAELRSHGLNRALVAVSGDLAIGDAPPRAKGWSVATNAGVMVLTRCAVSTSGDESQSFEWNGTRLSHIIDPRNGRPVPARPAVTVIAKHAMEADALATALYILEGAERTRLLKQYPNARMLPATPRAYRSSTR